MFIEGKIKKIINQLENDWGRYEIELPDGREYIAVGVIEEASVGMMVGLNGYESHYKSQSQFKINEVRYAKPDDNAGVRRFLCDGYIKGIGPVKAENIISEFGSTALDLFDTEIGRKTLTKAKGITENVINNALPSYEENKKYKGIVTFLKGMCTKKQVETIYKKYGKDALKVLTKNPYQLQIDLGGFGFTKADRIALACGIKPDSVYRVMAALDYTLTDAQLTGGHCFLTLKELKEKTLFTLVPMPKMQDDDVSIPTKEKITIKKAENAALDWVNNKEKFIKTYNPDNDILSAIEQTVESRNLVAKNFDEAIKRAVADGVLVNDDGCIYTKQMYEIETQTAQMIAEMMKKPSVRPVNERQIEKAIADVEKRKTEVLRQTDKDAKFIVTEEQKEAVHIGLSNRISIISGGPGRGKTAISEIIAHGFLSASKVYDKDDILMLAPTGRAAQRITESTGYAAMTAHRAIMQFKNGGNAPYGKLILCDESSMADIFLTHSILKFARNCNLIFVGDVDQIASVGPGKCLRDMIESETVPCILLKQGHRNSGTIAKNADLINAGIKLKNYHYDKHFVYVPSDKNNIMNVMINDYLEKIKEYGIKNVMLCSAMRDRGPVAVNKLNIRLQDELTKGNPEAVYEGKKFRVGDRVMQIKNDYSFLMIRDGKQSQGIFNGERGTVSKIVYDRENQSYNLVVVFDDGSVGGYTKGTVANLTLAYATTLHKCQGSEAKCMMMAYTFGDYMLLNRSLFYTGETRAKNEFRFYGEEKYNDYGQYVNAFDFAVSRIDDVTRNTALSSRIKTVYRQSDCKEKAV